MPESEKQMLNDQRLKELAETLDLLDPPSVEAVRWIYPEEVGSVVVDCLREAGFSASPTADGRGFKADAGTEAQIPVLRMAWYRCSAMYPMDPRTLHTSWTTAQKSVTYAYLTEALIPCLNDLGITGLDAPSRSVFLADPASWQYPDPGNGRTMDLWTHTCPPNPPSRAILGED